jgi:hypothetical protein
MEDARGDCTNKSGDRMAEQPVIGCRECPQRFPGAPGPALAYANHIRIIEPIAATQTEQKALPLTPLLEPGSAVDRTEGLCAAWKRLAQDLKGSRGTPAGRSKLVL